MSSAPNVTALLNKISEGDQNAPEKLLEVVYEELRKLAYSYFKNENPSHTLQPTALVHEAYIRLIDWKNVSWENRAQFFSVAAKVMRNILIDHARQKKTEKHGGNFEKIVLDETISFSNTREINLLDLDEALQELEQLNERQARIIELKFFTGLTNEETAKTLQVSEMTIKRDWNFAKTWLYRRLNNS